MADSYLSAQEIADDLHIDLPIVRAWIKKKLLPAIQLDGGPEVHRHQYVIFTRFHAREIASAQSSRVRRLERERIARSQKSLPLDDLEDPK
jgi:hypothetical protein